MSIITLRNKFNIPAFIAGVIIIYIVYSHDPWWILTAVGDNPTFYAYVAPYMIDISILGNPINLPVIHYITLSGFLTYLAIGLACIIGAFFPSKDWSKSLIGYRALIVPIVTMITLYIGLTFARNYVDVNIPLVGSKIIIYKLHYGNTVINTYTQMKSIFTDTFYLAIIAGALASIGRIVSGKE